MFVQLQTKNLETERTNKCHSTQAIPTNMYRPLCLLNTLSSSSVGQALLLSGYKGFAQCKNLNELMCDGELTQHNAGS